MDNKDYLTLPASLNMRYNKSLNVPSYQYRLIIYNSKLSKMLHNKKERAKLTEYKGAYYLHKDRSGNIINGFPEGQVVIMAVGKMLPREKINFRKTGLINKTVKIKFNLKPNEWGLNRLDIFLGSKYERELAESLIKIGNKVVPIRANQEDKLNNGCADLLIIKNKGGIPIEITTVSPSKTEALSGVNSPHGHQWTKISGRILNLLVYCFENNRSTFVIINKKWIKHNHVSYIIEVLNKYNCFVLLTDFKKGWSYTIANRINDKISS